MNLFTNKKSNNKKNLTTNYICSLMLITLIFLNSSLSNANRLQKSKLTKLTKQPKFKEFSLDNKSNSVTIAKNKFLALEIESNRSTGFMWFWDNPNQSLLKALNLDNLNSTSLYIQSEPNLDEQGNHHILVGLPGYDVFKFKAVKTGKMQMSFSYKQPWLLKEPELDRKFVNITVVENYE